MSDEVHLNKPIDKEKNGLKNNIDSSLQIKEEKKEALNINAPSFTPSYTYTKLADQKNPTKLNYSSMTFNNMNISQKFYPINNNKQKYPGNMYYNNNNNYNNYNNIENNRNPNIIYDKNNNYIYDNENYYYYNNYKFHYPEQDQMYYQQGYAPTPPSYEIMNQNNGYPNIYKKNQRYGRDGNINNNYNNKNGQYSQNMKSQNKDTPLNSNQDSESKTQNMNKAKTQSKLVLNNNSYIPKSMRDNNNQEIKSKLSNSNNNDFNLNIDAINYIPQNELLKKKGRRNPK